MYWDSVWNKNDIEDYRKYVQNYKGITNCMTRYFADNSCMNICDAACGFGANSMILLSNGFNVSGFDISEASVWLTCHLLEDEGIIASQFKVASLTDTGYDNNSFDAVAVRAALDHLSVTDFLKAVNEIKRITKEHGLLYASFDPIEDEDLKAEHIVLEDGSLLHVSISRISIPMHQEYP